MTDTPRQLFNVWVADHARGTLNDEITLAMAEVVEAVTHLDKAGKVVIEIQVEPTGSNGRLVMVSGKVTAKPPAPAPETSVFYAGESGSLHRSDPYQQRFNAETGELIQPEEGTDTAWQERTR